VSGTGIYCLPSWARLLLYRRRVGPQLTIWRWRSFPPNSWSRSCAETQWSWMVGRRRRKWRQFAVWRRAAERAVPPRQREPSLAPSPRRRLRRPTSRPESWISARACTLRLGCTRTPFHIVYTTGNRRKFSRGEQLLLTHFKLSFFHCFFSSCNQWLIAKETFLPIFMMHPLEDHIFVIVICIPYILWYINVDFTCFSFSISSYSSSSNYIAFIIWADIPRVQWVLMYPKKT